MGTHPIFESDFDCLTEEMPEKEPKRRPSVTTSVSTSKTAKTGENKAKIESVKRKSSEKKLKIEKERSGAKEVKTRKPSASSKEVASKDKKTEIRKKEKPKAAIFPDFDEDSLVNSNPATFATLSGDFGESVAEIKRHMTLMIKYKKEGINDRESYQQLRTKGCLQIAILKRLNRLAQMGARQIREQTKDQLTGSDEHFLKLQNLQYQAHHLQNEIDSCMGFQSAHKKLDLKPAAEFTENAPETLREGIVSVDEELDEAEKEHRLTCARLKWENEERLELKKAAELIEAEKERLEELTQVKLTNLNNVRPQLQHILQVANGVRNKLGLGGVVGIIGEAVSYLTGPLAAIYKAGIAYRQTSGDVIEVAIKGDEKEAKELKEKGIEDDDEIAQRHESADGDDQGNRRSRKKKKSSKGWFPVWVEWKIGEHTISFKHSTINKAIYAESATDPAKPELSGLYPDDSGLSDTTTTFGRNYWWCSQLAGLVDLPEGQNLAEFVSDVVKRIKARFDNRQLIAKHIRALEVKELPEKLGADNILVTGSLAGFEPLEEFNSHRGFDAFTDGKHFKLTIDRKVGARLSVQCSISPNYPADSSLFVIECGSLNATNCPQLQYLEELVNLRIPLEVSDQSKVLSTQIAAMMSQPHSLKVTTRNRFNPIKIL